MATIGKFEDIQAWQKSRTLVRAIYEITREGQLARDFTLRDQIRRAALSIMTNIAEGFARRTSKEFVNFLAMAHGSAAEVQSQLYVALDFGYISKPTFDKLYVLADEISRMVQSFMAYLKTNSKLTTRNSELVTRRNA